MFQSLFFLRNDKSDLYNEPINGNLTYDSPYSESKFSIQLDNENILFKMNSSNQSLRLNIPSILWYTEIYKSIKCYIKNWRDNCNKNTVLFEKWNSEFKRLPTI